MKRPGLLATMLGPLLATLVIGSVALGLFVSRAVEQDLIATVDDELARASSGRLDQRPGPGAGRRPTPSDATADSPADSPGDPPTQVNAISDSTDGTDLNTEELESEAEAPIEFSVTPDGRIVETKRAEPVLDAAGVDELIAGVRANPAGAELATVDGDPRHRILLQPVPDGRILVVGLPLDQVDQSLDSLRSNLVLGGVVLFGLQALMVFGVARAVNRPVARLSDTAHRIAGGDLDAHVGPPSGPRETAGLTTDLAAMLDRLRATIGQRERAAADADRARRNMERFMADASHELRTPLTALRGYSDLYRSDMLEPADLDRVMDRIGSESERLTDLVGELLDMVRPAEAVRSDPVDLGAVASAVVHDLRAANPDHELDIELPARGDGSTVSALGDAARLHQAVLNLGANACHHTPPGSAVTVAVGSEGSEAVLRVIDDGPGIDQEAAESVFQPFARGDASRSRVDHNGAGLGLALVRRIAEQHDGTVAYEPTPGGGATFVLRLPLLATSPGLPI